jgi:hypothetical protein
MIKKERISVVSKNKSDINTSKDDIKENNNKNNEIIIKSNINSKNNNKDNNNNNNDFLWEIFNISGIYNLMKKTLFSSFYYKNNDKDGILIIGGKNLNRKECNDVLFFDFNNMTINNFENSDLNTPCCFNNSNFISFNYNSNNLDFLYNISKDSKIYLFNYKTGKFIKTN